MQCSAFGSWTFLSRCAVISRNFVELHNCNHTALTRSSKPQGLVRFRNFHHFSLVRFAGLRAWCIFKSSKTGAIHQHILYDAYEATCAWISRLCDLGYACGCENVWNSHLTNSCWRRWPWKPKTQKRGKQSNRMELWLKNGSNALPTWIHSWILEPFFRC